jgi:hypothetical protein
LYLEDFTILNSGLWCPYCFLSLYSTAFADEFIRDERRVWSDGFPQEVWSYDGTVLPENLVLKELFFESGAKRRQENFVGGVQHGQMIAWYEEGSIELEEMWLDCGRHGMVTRWYRTFIR